MKVIILGSGRIGTAMALDLVQDNQFQVTVADIDGQKLSLMKQHRGIHCIYQDLSDRKKLKKLIKNFDLVIDALPGFMGFTVFQEVISAGKNIIDIAFFPEDPFVLHHLAVEMGVTALMDCGVAPGMSNLLVGYATSQLEETNDIKYMWWDFRR